MGRLYTVLEKKPFLILILINLLYRKHLRARNKKVSIYFDESALKKSTFHLKTDEKRRFEYSGDFVTFSHFI